MEVNAEGSVTPPKVKPIKVLPTERVGFDTQLAILRAYAAASGSQHKAASNAEVGSIAGLSQSSISVCNQFWNDIGLLYREGQKQKPADEVFEYSTAYSWNASEAGKKLAPILRSTWFAEALLPALGFRSLSLHEAITRLADAAKALPKYKPNLRILIDYLGAAQLLALDNDTLKIVESTNPLENQSQKPPVVVQPANPQPTGRHVDEISEDMEQFTIPIPGKEAAVIAVPKDLDHEDWVMLEAMIKTYITRLRKARGLTVITETVEGDQT